MIENWKPAEVKAIKKKVPLIHLKSPHVAHSPWCRQSLWGAPRFLHSEKESEVTCERCKKIAASVAART